MTLPKTLTTMRCPCGELRCKKWIISPLFISTNCGLEKEEAEEVVRRWNGFEATIAPKHVEILEWAVEQASGWKGGAGPEEFGWWDDRIAKMNEALEQVRTLRGDPSKVSDPALLRILLDRALARKA